MTTTWGVDWTGQDGQRLVDTRAMDRIQWKGRMGGYTGWVGVGLGGGQEWVDILGENGAYCRPRKRWTPTP